MICVKTFYTKSNKSTPTTQNAKKLIYDEKHCRIFRLNIQSHKITYSPFNSKMNFTEKIFYKKFHYMHFFFVILS